MPLINEAINNFNPEVRFACIAAVERKIKICDYHKTTGINKNDRCEQKSKHHLHLLDHTQYLCHFPYIGLYILNGELDLNCN